MQINVTLIKWWCFAKTELLLTTWVWSCLPPPKVSWQLSLPLTLFFCHISFSDVENPGSIQCAVTAPLFHFGLYLVGLYHLHVKWASYFSHYSSQLKLCAWCQFRLEKQMYLYISNHVANHVAMLCFKWPLQWSSICSYQLILDVNFVFSSILKLFWKTHV